MSSQPTHGVAVQQDLLVEMRDGTRLATDVYRPATAGTCDPLEDPRPALLLRTPYDKRARNRIEHQGNWFAQRGYVVAIQDCRGRYASDGEFVLHQHEAADGYDTVEWLADQPYCDGQVGTIGTSYSAWTQNALAALDPPHLAAMFVNQGAASAWEATFRHNGAFELRWLTWALTIGGGFAKRALTDPVIQQRLANVDTRDVLASLPIQPGQSPLRHIPGYEDWVFQYMRGDGDDPVWEDPSLDFAAHYDEMASVPTVYAGSWYDSYAKATVDNYAALADRYPDQFLVMGAWTHGGVSTWERTWSGELDYGAAGTMPYNETRLRFFDHYLKGLDTWEESPVQYVRLGVGDGGKTPADRLRHGSEWASADAWPVPGTEFTRYYAHGDGTLATEEPSADEDATSYDFDPDDPVPTLGGNCSSYYTFEPREESIEAYPLADRPALSITGRGGWDQRTRPDTFGADPPYGPLAHRDDVLVYRTPPLAEPVEIAGPIRVRVFASTDAPDTDFTAKLVDEYPPSETWPDGFALNLADGIVRARYRDHRRDPEPVDPGVVYEFEVQPYPTANVFRAGHRIRLDISSSNFPRFDVNQNTGGPLAGDRESRVATNTVYHDRDRPTHVELPVQPAD